MLLPLAFLAAVPAALAQAQNLTYLTGLVQTLTAQNLTQLAQVAANINSTAAGQALLAGLPNGNLTLFAPNDQACESSCSS